MVNVFQKPMLQTSLRSVADMGQVLGALMVDNENVTEFVRSRYELRWCLQTLEDYV